MINIGDTVRFLNATGGGIVTRIKDNLAYVADSDGFETPVLIKECVVVAAPAPANHAGFRAQNGPGSGRTNAPATTRGDARGRATVAHTGIRGGRPATPVIHHIRRHTGQPLQLLSALYDCHTRPTVRGLESARCRYDRAVNGRLRIRTHDGRPARHRPHRHPGHRIQDRQSIFPQGAAHI